MARGEGLGRRKAAQIVDVAMTHTATIGNLIPVILYKCGVSTSNPSKDERL